MAVRAISIMHALIVDVDTKLLYSEYEVCYSDGTVRFIKVLANQSVRIDLDQLFVKPSIPPPP